MDLPGVLPSFVKSVTTGNAGALKRNAEIRTPVDAAFLSLLMGLGSPQRVRRVWEGAATPGGRNMEARQSDARVQVNTHLDASQLAHLALMLPKRALSVLQCRQQLE